MFKTVEGDFKEEWKYSVQWCILRRTKLFAFWYSYHEADIDLITGYVLQCVRDLY